MSKNISCNEVELSKFLSSIGIIPYAFDAARAVSDKNLPYDLINSPYGFKVLALNCRPDDTTRFVNSEFGLVSSQDHEVVDFIKTKVNPLFSINKAAVELFQHLMSNMNEDKKKDIKSPLIVTGWGLGGYLAIMTTLWLQSTMYEEESKRLICITFGTPLIGDEALRRVISKRPKWESCFLNVVSMTDYVASLVPTEGEHNLYKPFGSFLFCTESGGHTTFNDHEAILAVLNTMTLPSDAKLGKHDYKNDLIELRKVVLRRRVYESSGFELKPLTEGIRLQFKEIGVLEKISNDTIKSMELKQEKMIASKMHTYEPTKKLNDIKISMTYMEWYIKTRQSKGGYYNCYKKDPTRNEYEGHQNIITQHRSLNKYWNNFVEDKDQNPQKEHSKLRTRWLLSGNNYRRMIEPLDIAKHYKKPLGVGEHHERPTKYLENRPDRYKLLESWLKEDQKDVNDVKRNKAPNLNEDSCFWAHVEEALISLKELKINANSSVDQENIKEFMDYVMHGIEEFLVSPDIFLEGSSLMTWWSEYKSSDTYKQGSCRSKFAQYMENGSYTSYK